MAEYERYRSRRVIEVKALPDGRLTIRGGERIDRETLDREWEKLPKPEAPAPYDEYGA